VDWRERDLHHALRNVMTFAEWSLQQALQLVTLNAARVLGISDQRPATLRSHLSPGRSTENTAGADSIL
jgi:hypothetical protein